MKSYWLIAVLVLALSCTGTPEKSEAMAEFDFADQEALQMPLRAQISDGVSFEAAKIIKQSTLVFETQDMGQTYKDLVGFVKGSGGFIQSDNSNKSHNRTSRTLTVRVPSPKFQTVLDSVENRVDFFDTRHISQRDVTEEFIDVQARLQTQRTLEQRYLQLLSRANSVKDMLEIERKLAKIRGDIESRQGRLKYLEDRVALSTLTIEFYKIKVQTSVSSSYGARMLNALKSGFNGLSIFLLVLIQLWPLLLIIIVGTILVRKRLKKKRES